jgi:hypothetical protein
MISLSMVGGAAHADGLCSSAGNLGSADNFEFELRLREMGLGPLHTIGLAEARQRAQDCRRERLDGFDPIDVPKADRQRAQRTTAR